jgi:hypothetical protein
MKLIVTSEANLNGGLFKNPERRYDAKYSEFCTRPDKSEFQTLFLVLKFQELKPVRHADGTRRFVEVQLGRSQVAK